MSGLALEKAAAIQAPIAAANPAGNTGVHRIAVSGSAQSFALPAGMIGKYITLFCTAEIQYALGLGAAPTIVLNQAAALGTGHAAAGKTLTAGQDKDVPIPKAATHIGWIGTTGFVEIYCSETPA